MKTIVKLTLLILFALAVLSTGSAGRAAALPAAVPAIANSGYCAIGLQHPLINGIAAKYNTPAAILSEWNCAQGHDLGEIMLAIHTSWAAQDASVDEVLAARAQGNSWDSIWNQLHLISTTSVTSFSESSRQNNQISLTGILLVIALITLVNLARHGKYNIHIPQVIGQSVVGSSTLNPTGPPNYPININKHHLTNPIPIQ